MLPPPLAISPPRADRRQAALNLLTTHSSFLACALFLLAGLFAAGDYGYGLDEPDQREIAAANLDYILGKADRVVTEYYYDRTYGVAFELPLLLLERALRLEDYYYGHRLRVIVTHLLFIVGGFFCYRLAWRLFDHRLIALFALLIFLLHPRLYGHSFANTKDLPFLSLLVLALYLLERACRRNTPGAFALLGVAVGLLANLRIMGAALLFAVIALRGLDWLYARSGTERKGIALSCGLFVLAAGLTLYAVTPYAWANPVDYLAASLDLTVNHPVVWPQLFRGEWFPSDQLPPHYNAVWFAITTPLPLLLLGGMGLAAAAVRCGRRPLAALADNRRRFLLLLLAGFLLPPLAVALLGSNQYNDWRHLYFVYVPFGLLAAGGLHWLAAALARRRWRAGVYGLAGLGLGLILLQIIQLHPLQHLYFNPLVDRATPERLRTQYHLSFGELAYWAALKGLLKDYPDATLTVRTNHRGEFDLLPPAARGRLRPAAEDSGPADYYMRPNLAPGQPDLAFNAGYRRIYNNAVIALRPLDSSRMTAAAVAAYREIYRQAIGGEPIIRAADYAVYRNGQRLTFVQENCPPDSRDAWFAAQPFPPAPEILPPNAAEIRFYIDYNLGNHGVRLGDVCLAVLQLPADLRGDILLSQHNLGPFHPTGPPVWMELYNWSPPGLRERIAQLRQDQPPAAPNAFAVFLDQDAAGRHRLLYAKANCAWAEYETAAFLHILPESLADLPFYLWASGVDNREFRLPRYGVRLGGECLAVFPLPDYPIAALLTGQSGIWETHLYPPADPSRLRAAYAALANRQPNARATFDLYRQDRRLVYLRESCAAGDTAAGFFLHIIPEDIEDLPADRRDAGFANQDFPFARYGGSFDGKCLAAVPLPDYPIKTLRTGQYVPGRGEVWAMELTLEP